MAEGWVWGGVGSDLLDEFPPMLERLAKAESQGLRAFLTSCVTICSSCSRVDVEAPEVLKSLCEGRNGDIKKKIFSFKKKTFLRVYQLLSGEKQHCTFTLG